MKTSRESCTYYRCVTDECDTVYMSVGGVPVGLIEQDRFPGQYEEKGKCPTHDKVKEVVA